MTLSLLDGRVPVDRAPAAPSGRAPARPASPAGRVAVVAKQLPSPGVSMLLAAMVCISLVPSVLPRPALAQAVLTGLALAAGTFGAWLARRVGALGWRVARAGTSRARGLPSRLSLPPRGRTACPSAPRRVGATALFGVVAATLVVLCLAVAHTGQQDLRVATGQPPVGAGYWLVAAGGAVAVRLALAAAARGLRAVADRLWLSRGPVVLLVGALCCVAAAPVASSTAWGVLNSPRDSANVLEQTSPLGGIRTYVGLDRGGTAQERAELAVRRLDEAGAFEREAVVLAVPTGSGWVDPSAVEGFERRFGGDVATVSLQSSYAPSWAALMFAREESDRTAQTLFDAVADRLAALPSAERPNVYLHGESLGALSGQSVFADARARDLVCGAVWVGAPGGETAGVPQEVSLANADDPVVHWSSALAWERPDTWTESLWVPVASYLGTSVDLLTSRAFSPGHGHVYGLEQASALPGTCPR